MRRLRTEVKHHLRHLQKPFYKLQSLSRSGDVAVPPDEIHKLEEYLKDPLVALAAEDNSYPILRSILTKLNSAIAQGKLKLKAQRKAQKALKGVMMELDDCAFPLLAGMRAHSDPKTPFKDLGIALLVGARPRGPGMERKDLLSANAQIFTAQGRALDEAARRDVKVLVVGNPANTNAHIAMKSAQSLARECFTAMLRLDHNRAHSQLAAKTGKPVDAIEKVIVWGNHSPTMYPDYRSATIAGQPAPQGERRGLVPRHLHPVGGQAR